jgi:hypothetical protein
MKMDRYAALATRLLKGSMRGSSLALGDRARGVAAVEHALRRRVRRRRLARGLVIGAAASVALVAGLTLRRGLTEVGEGPPTSTPAARVVTAALGMSASAKVMRAGARTAADAALVDGDEILAGLEGAQVRLSTGTRLFVGAEGRLDLLALGPQARLALRAGRVRAEVARLGAGERFVLETADAEVEVKGTSFEVAIVPQPGCPLGSTTRVEVFEGIVQVRRGREPEVETITLGARTRWLNTCVDSDASERVAARPAPPSPPTSDAPAARVRPSHRPVSPAAASATAVLPAQSTLAAENDLFEAALLAERTGDLSAALRHLDELLVRFPHGSLAGPAREHRLRLARRPLTPEAP